MKTRTELIELGKEFLSGAPAHGSKGAPDLLGFSGPVGFVCSHCAGRIIARGCHLKSLADVPVWAGHGSPKCDLC